MTQFSGLRSNFELNLSLLVVLFLAAVYIGYEVFSSPSGGHPFGHMLGILGATLMIMTEVLYSARKRWRIIKFGQIRHWLSFHIFTGIVGPALVFMHTGLASRGLAGLTMFLTALVVASGFLGRFIYTAVPRTMAGLEVDRRTLEARVLKQRQEMVSWAANKPAQVKALVQQELALTKERKDLSPAAILSRRLLEARERRRLRMAIRKLDKEERARMAEVERLLRQQQRLVRQIDSLQTVRRMMGWWHTFHVPLGLTLFSAMFIHIIASIYYGGV
jgi:hypothetical protein